MLELPYIHYPWYPTSGFQLPCCNQVLVWWNRAMEVVLHVLVLLPLFLSATSAKDSTMEVVLFIPGTDQFVGHVNFHDIYEDEMVRVLVEVLLPSLPKSSQHAVTCSKIGGTGITYKTISSLTSNSNETRQKVQRWLNGVKPAPAFPLSGLSSAVEYSYNSVYSKESKKTVKVMIVLCNHELKKGLYGLFRNKYRRMLSSLIFVAFPWPNQNCSDIQTSLQTISEQKYGPSMVICSKDDFRRNLENHLRKLELAGQKESTSKWLLEHFSVENAEFESKLNKLSVLAQ